MKLLTFIDFRFLVHKFILIVNFYFFCMLVFLFFLIFFFKQKTAYGWRIIDWSSDVCSSDLLAKAQAPGSQIIGFLADNLSTYHLMLRQESLVDGQIDKAVLLRVTEREITAGRMKGNDPLRAFAEGGEYIRDNPMEGLFHADPSADVKPVLN